MKSNLSNTEHYEQINLFDMESHGKGVYSDLPLDWENVFYSDARAQGVHAESISDGLVFSLSNLGKVDIEYISAVTGADYKSVISALKGSIYQNPDTWNECFYQGWETAEEYLSGNLMRKLRSAKKADEKLPGYFADNIRAIKSVMPKAVMAEDIYVTIGSPWVPADVIDEFILHLFGDPCPGFGRSKASRADWMKLYQTVHDELTGAWQIPEKSRYNHSVAVRSTYGTDRIEALSILEKTLNMKTIKITDEIKCPDHASGKKRVLNKEETVAALEKQQILIDEFKKWIWQDADRKKRLETIFENNYGCVRRRLFDGSFLEFPGMSEDMKLYPYQKNAAARIIFTPNTLLAHDVGAGKTYVMIAAGQELRRMKLSQKNMYVVPNNIVGQWESIFREMYPDARLLCIESKSFVPQKREEVLGQIRDLKYDGIIIAYSCFEQIPLSKDCYIDALKHKKEKIIESICRKGALPGLKKKLEAVEKELAELSVTADENKDKICFDQLGITRLFIDEAHNFKNVPIETKTSSVLGISAGGSKKCQDMLDKVHVVQKQNDGKGVVMATGTPITNSVTDAYIMQQYLQSGELEILDLQNFDSWIGMFAEKVTEFEIDVDTSTYRLATRFAKFHNLPELTALLSAVADFHSVDKGTGIPEFDVYTDMVLPKTDAFAEYLKDISRRADEVRNGRVSRQEDNMLKITTDGRKAALDLRLTDPQAEFTCQSKVWKCAENVAGIYFQTEQDRSTQLIFCDTSTPKAGFNIYTELKKALIELGVPEEQIAFVHDASTEAKRKKLFRNIREGSIRILIGSTFKLGIGVNVQDKLIALHHIDVPWRPADMTQREGRILRQGNTNRQVYIYRYVTEGSFDAYSWQLLETKQRFISGLLSGSMEERSGSDIEGTVLDYAEVKALAVGNPMVKQRVEAANELTRYLTLQRKLMDSRMKMETELLELPGKIQDQQRRVDECKADMAFYLKWKKENPPVTGTVLKKQEKEQRREFREFLGNAVRNYTLEKKEKKLQTYHGFYIILPANMRKDKPYIWLSRHGRYSVELGDNDTGNLIRIDNWLEHLADHLDRLRGGLVQLQERQKDIRIELAKNDSYADQIERYKTMVETMDKMLGVDKK